MRSLHARTACLAAALTGCFATSASRRTEHRDKVVEVEESLDDGSEVILAATTAPDGAVRILAQERPMCRTAQRGTIETVTRVVRARKLRCDGTCLGRGMLLVAVAVAAGALVESDSPALMAGYGGLGAGSVVLPGLLPRTREVASEPRTERFHHWAGEREPCGDPRPAPGITLRVTPNPASGEPSWSVRTSEDGSAALGVAGAVVEAASFPASATPHLVRVDVDGLPDSLTTERPGPGHARGWRSYVPLVLKVQATHPAPGPTPAARAERRAR